MDHTHGTCSLCGGAVTTPSTWGGLTPPKPTCSSCGATAKQPHGPKIEMERAPFRTTGAHELRLQVSTSEAASAPFVVGALHNDRPFAEPLATVGPVRSGVLRRFEN